MKMWRFAHGVGICSCVLCVMWCFYSFCQELVMLLNVNRVGIL
jgi:hypothetical protein